MRVLGPLLREVLMVSNMAIVKVKDNFGTGLPEASENDLGQLRLASPTNYVMRNRAAASTAM